MWPADKARPTVYLLCVRWVLNAQRQDYRNGIQKAGVTPQWSPAFSKSLVIVEFDQVRSRQRMYFSDFMIFISFDLCFCNLLIFLFLIK